MSFVQRSNEYNTKNLEDSINYKVSYQNLNDSTELANKFIAKPRVIKEKENLGAFRIPQETLKKHVNPSEYLNAQKYNEMANYRASMQQRSNVHYNSASDDDIDFNHYSPNQEITGNLIDVLGKTVEKLKAECEMKQRQMEMNKKIESVKQNNYTGKEVIEDKVSTNYLNQNNDRIQAFKHVATQNKPEYNTLEDLQKEKEKHLQKLKQSEMKYESFKSKQADSLNRFSSKMSNGDELTEPSVNVNVERVLKHTEKDLEEFKALKSNTRKLKMPTRPRSSLLYGRRGVDRGYSEDEPLRKSDKKYLKKYQAYMLKKQKLTHSKIFEEENTIEWNTTKVRSYNSKGVTDRKDNLPGRLDVGHLDGEDYSLYYMSIDSGSMSLSQSLSRSNSKPKKYKKGYQPNNDNEMMNLSYDYAKVSASKGKGGRPATTTNKGSSKTNLHQTFNQSGQSVQQNKKHANVNLTSNIAFLKMIFNLLDKAGMGEVKKLDLLRDLNLDHNIMKDLGFVSEEDLLNQLKEFPTKKEGYVSEDEFIHFLLSNIEIGGIKRKHQQQHISSATAAKNKTNGRHNPEDGLVQIGAASIGEDKFQHVDNKKISFSKDKLFQETPKVNQDKIRHVVNHEYPENMEYSGYNEHIDEKDLLNMTPPDKQFYQSNFSQKGQQGGYQSNANEHHQYDQSGNNYYIQHQDQYLSDQDYNQSQGQFHQNQDYNNFTNYAQGHNEEDYINYGATQYMNDYNDKLTRKFNKKIQKKSNQSFTKTEESFNATKVNHPRKIQVSYKDYRDFTHKFKTRNEMTFTIPKPYSFQMRDDDGKKQAKIQRILDERREKEDAILGYRFRANELKSNITMNLFETMKAAEAEVRKYNLEQYKLKIEAEMKPFSFYEDDKRKYLEKLHKKEEVPDYGAFKANPIPWSSQVNIYEDMMTKGKVLRQTRIEERARQNLINAKLPPRMEMHEKKKKEAENNMKLLKQENEASKRSKSTFKAKDIPQFSKIHEQLNKNLEKKKSIAKLTETKPFNFHEPKKKATLRGYLDRENDPESKNPTVKKNIVEIIQQIQQKPKVEPKSTKALNLLMAQRRKEMEDKQKEEERRQKEDEERKKKQDTLKDRVRNSNFLVDNTKKNEEDRKQKQIDFKKNLAEEKRRYEEELKIRLQRVYNKPLMFESSTKKMDKTSNMLEMKEKLGDLIEEPTEEEMREREKRMRDEYNMEHPDNKMAKPYQPKKSDPKITTVGKKEDPRGSIASKKEETPQRFSKPHEETKKEEDDSKPKQIKIDFVAPKKQETPKIKEKEKPKVEHSIEEEENYGDDFVKD